MFDFTSKCSILYIYIYIHNVYALPGGVSEFMVIFIEYRYARITTLI